MNGVLLLSASRSDHTPIVLVVMLLLAFVVVILQAGAQAKKGPRAPILPTRLDVELGELRVLPGGLCQVCGTVLEGEIVRCESCRTPHHRDCWNYLGRCSTYGCDRRRAA